jgi:hypothetical protein
VFSPKEAGAINSVCLVGRLARDPVLVGSGPDDSPTVRLIVLVDRPFDPGATDAIPVQATGKLAAVCARYCRRGRLVSVEGRLLAPAGTADAVAVRAETVRFLDPPGSGARSAGPVFAAVPR